MRGETRLLHLQSETSADWAAHAATHIDTILVDHAHLEKKAASAALRLLFMHPEHSAFQRPLSALAREELEHFEAVLDELAVRHVPLVRQKPSPYFGRLQSAARQPPDERLLDTLLCAALIEARSCDRMKALASALGHGPRLQQFYEALLVSEARHFRLYIDLAETLARTEIVRSRPEVLALHEAKVLELSGPEPRMHS